MRIAVCDDEECLCEQLTGLIKEFFLQNSIKLPHIQIYNSGEALLEEDDVADIIFLDVKMRGRDGIYVGNQLKGRNSSALIFMVTSFQEYLDDAMKFNVFRYLSKPVDRARLFRNLKDAVDVYNSSVVKVEVEIDNGIRIIHMLDVVLAECENNKVVIHTKDGVYHSRHTMDYWDKKLDKGCFLRCHRSYIINMDYVTGFEKGKIYLNEGRNVAYMPLRRYKGFKDVYLSYLERI